MYSMEIKTHPIPTCILVKKHVDLPYVWPGYPDLKHEQHSLLLELLRACKIINSNLALVALVT